MDARTEMDHLQPGVLTPAVTGELAESEVTGSRSVPAGRLPSPRTLGAIFLLPAAALAIAAFASAVAGIPVDAISRDPLATAAVHPLTGIQSVLGVAMLWAAASICIFAWLVLHRGGRAQDMAAFILWSGLLTALLAVDDQFQIHDDLFSRYLDGPERFVILGWLALILVYLVHYRRQILDGEWMLLGLALALMAASVGVDALSGSPSLSPDGHWTGASSVFLFFEDGLKLLGITAWAAYFMRIAYRALVPDPWTPWQTS